VPGVERQVLGHRLVGVQPDLGQPEFGRITIGAIKEQSSVTASLGTGRNGNHLQQQVVCVGFRHKRSDNGVAAFQHPHPRMLECRSVVSGHRGRRPTDALDVFRV